MSALEQSITEYKDRLEKMTPMLGSKLAEMHAEDVFRRQTGFSLSVAQTLLQREALDPNRIITFEGEKPTKPATPIEIISLDLLTLNEAIDKHQGPVYGGFLPLGSTIRDMGVILLQDLTTGLPHYIESAQWQEGKREHTYVSALYTNTGSLNGIFYKDAQMTQTVWPGKSQESDKLVIAKVRPIIASATQAVMNL